MNEKIPGSYSSVSSEANNRKTGIQIEIDKVISNKLAEINQKINDKGVSIKDYILSVETSHDQAFQRANDYIRQLAITSNLTKIPSLLVPTGRYIINKEVKLSPYVKVVSEGFVNFDITHNGTGFYVAPNTDDPKFSQAQSSHLSKNSWNRGKMFDGSHGPIVFTATPFVYTDVTTKTIALEIGSRDAASHISTPVSRYVVENVNAFGFDIALKLNCVNNYIGTFKNCHLELVNHAIYFKSPTSAQINSGENFVFDNFVIAGAKKEAVYIDAPGHDMTFNNTSFDFNASRLFYSRRSGTNIRLNHCYFEKIGDGTGEQIMFRAETTVAGETLGHGRISLTFDKCIAFLQRPTKLFENIPNGSNEYLNMYIDIDGLELRYQELERPNATDLSSRFLIDNTPRTWLINKRLLNTSITRSLISKDLNLFRNGDFNSSTLNADLSLAGGDTSWLNSYKSGITNPIIVAEGVGGTNCLKYTVSNTAANSMKLENKFKYNVEAGDMIAMSTLIKIDKASSRNELVYRLECYDANDALVDTLNYSDTLNPSGTVVNLDGTVFRIPRSVGTFQIPYGVQKIKPVIIVNNVDATFVCLDEIYLSKFK